MPAETPLDALFVGYEDQENLGLRYIVANARRAGLRADLVPFSPFDPAAVLRTVDRQRPALVGLSIIFQYSVERFAALARALRDNGFAGHLTAGGHFPSLRPRDVLDEVPELDSVVRHEGERTVVELMRLLGRPEEWPSIQGLVFRTDGTVTVNPPRPLVEDLDSLPAPIRDEPRVVTRGVRTASILASRGCVYDCSFCSIRQFYGGAPGPVRRTRRPRAVVEEMGRLHEDQGIRFFIFQDDDFAASSRQQRRWLDGFLAELSASGLSRRVHWKISCRVDEVDAERMARCRDLGLIAVYLGVESGSASGLRTLNKHVTPEQNLAALDVLKRVGLAFEMGFMLFAPDTTEATLRENLAFLERALGDGSCPINFCKMLPYAGTPIEEQLRREGRLRGTTSQPDYAFTDPRLDWYAFFVARTFRFRNFDRLGLVERLRVSWLDQLLAREVENAPWANDYRHALGDITRRANELALRVLRKALDFTMAGEAATLARDWPLLDSLAEELSAREAALQGDLDRCLERFSPHLLAAYAEEFSRRLAEGPTGRISSQHTAEVWA